MEKVSYVTEYILVKVNTDSKWDDCTFAIIYFTKEWRQLLRERSAWQIQFKKDSSFYSLTYWDSHVVFFIHTGGEEETLWGSDLMEKDETWAYVTITEDELSRFRMPKNKMRAHRLIIAMDRTAQFQAWGDHTDEKFYTDEMDIDSLLAQPIPAENGGSQQ